VNEAEEGTHRPSGASLPVSPAVFMADLPECRILM
jgi:hypothetical protein